MDKVKLFQLIFVALTSLFVVLAIAIGVDIVLTFLIRDAGRCTGKLIRHSFFDFHGIFYFVDLQLLLSRYDRVLASLTFALFLRAQMEEGGRLLIIL